MTYAQQVANSLSNMGVIVSYTNLVLGDVYFFTWLRSTLGDDGALEFVSIITHRYLLSERRN